MSVVFLSLVVQVGSHSQGSLQTSDPAFSRLVENVAEPLQHAKARKIIVFDLRGSNGQIHPVGRWLADQVAQAIGSKFPGIAVIDRSLLKPDVMPASNPHQQSDLFEADVKQARALGANTMITGSFAKVADQLGVSLSIASLSKLQETQETGRGMVPISRTILDLAAEPMPGLELHDGIVRAGAGGIGKPVCTDCPPPNYPRSGRGGVVLLEVVVRPDGRSGKITILETPDSDLADSAVRGVRKWRFKPATGLDGAATAAFVQIQVSFVQR